MVIFYIIELTKKGVFVCYLKCLNNVITSNLWIGIIINKTFVNVNVRKKSFLVS